MDSLIVVVFVVVVAVVVVVVVQEMLIQSLLMLSLTHFLTIQNKSLLSFKNDTEQTDGRIA